MKYLATPLPCKKICILKIMQDLSSSPYLVSNPSKVLLSYQREGQKSCASIHLGAGYNQSFFLPALKGSSNSIFLAWRPIK